MTLKAFVTCDNTALRNTIASVLDMSSAQNIMGSHCMVTLDAEWRIGVVGRGERR